MEKRPVREAVSRFVLKQEALAVGAILKPLLDTIEIHMPPDMLEKAVSAVKQGMWLTMLGNHQSWADVLPLVVIGKAVMKAVKSEIPNNKLTHIDLPIAATIIAGQQGKPLKLFLNLINPWARYSGTKLRPVIRSQDLIDDPEIKSMHAASMRGMYRGALLGESVLSLLLRGSVVEARTNETTGKRNGLDTINGPTVFTGIVTKLYEKGHDTIIFPVAFDQTYRLIDPAAEHHDLTPEARQAMLHNTFNPGNPHILAKVTVGEPLYARDLFTFAQGHSIAEEQLPAFLNNTVLAAAARDLPRDARGKIFPLIGNI